MQSEAFADATLETFHHGSAWRTCDLCGREHFTHDRTCFEGDDLEQLEAKAEKDPDHCVMHDGSVLVGIIDGKQYIIDCQCNKLQQYEAFIWENRELIANYLVARATANLEAAQADKDTADKAARATTEEA